MFARVVVSGHLLQLVSQSPLPKCQGQARERWLAARESELLDTSYSHNPRLFYDLLFTATTQTLLEIASDAKHLGAEIGVIAILHTWVQNLLLHPMPENNQTDFLRKRRHASAIDIANLQAR